MYRPLLQSLSIPFTQSDIKLSVSTKTDKNYFLHEFDAECRRIGFQYVNKDEYYNNKGNNHIYSINYDFINALLYNDMKTGIYDSWLEIERLWKNRHFFMRI